MPHHPRLLIAGCGDIGSRLGVHLSRQAWTVHGLRRSIERLPVGIQPVAGDLSDARAPADWPTMPLDYVVFAAAATRHDESGYRSAYVEGLGHVLDWLRQHGQAPRRILFVSSSSVYGQRDGEWVDETSPTEPEGYNGRLLLEAEQLLQQSEFAATVVRLTGLYGPGREWLLNQVRQGYQVSDEPPLYGNRIHADDAAGLLACLLEADHQDRRLDDIYVGVDDEPAPLHEVIAWLRNALGVTHRTEGAAPRRGGSKRCRNQRSRDLGWTPRYPSFREGYASILAASRDEPAR